MAQLAKARNSFRMGVVVVALLHWLGVGLGFGLGLG